MHITDLSQIDNNYDHVYLAPHLDDAALSCGGAIAKQRAAGERVLVVTLCTAAPPPEGPFSALAEEFHRQWALSPGEAVAARLREDQLAMERLDVDDYWAGMLDAIYRYPEAYHSRATLFSAPSPDDPLLPALQQFIVALRDRCPHARLYAPLGVGSHVDHLITHNAFGESVDNVFFYEDFPYVAKPGALEERMAGLNGRFSPSTVAIDETLTRKIHAINAYASQLDELFGGPEAMAQSVTQYAAGLQTDPPGYCERLWSRQ